MPEITQADVRLAARKAVANKMKKLKRHIDAVEAKSNSWKSKYKAEVGSLRGRVRQLESAIRWALGEEGEFGEEPPPLAGKYRRRFWWRTELRERAFPTRTAARRIPAHLEKP